MSTIPLILTGHTKEGKVFIAITVGDREWTFEATTVPELRRQVERELGYLPLNVF